jgi:PKD repeat protein
MADVFDLPNAAFSYSGTCFGDNTQFTDSNTKADFISWDFGDGNSSSDPAPLHVYSAAGNFTVKKLVRSVSGCVDSVSQAIIINPAPDADWTAGSHGDTLIFQAKDTSLQSYTWDLGDAAISKAYKVSHVYATAGQKLVKLTVISAAGCTSSYDSTVTATVTVSIDRPKEQDFNFSLYPNPFSSDMQINYTLPSASAVKMEMVDMTGKIILLQKAGLQEQGSHSFTMDADALGLNKGIYLLRLYINEDVINRTVAKTN